MDPFERLAQKHRSSQERDYQECMETVERICDTIKDKSSSLHKLISSEVERYSFITILPKDLPGLSKDFEKLSKCTGKYKDVEDKLNTVSKYLKIRNNFGRCDEYRCNKIPGLSIDYNSLGYEE